MLWIDNSRFGKLLRCKTCESTCGNGHLKTDETWVKSGKQFRCTICSSEYSARYNATERGRAKNRIKQAKLREVQRVARLAEPENREADLAKRNDDKATAPHNALKPRLEAMPLWEEFQKYFDDHRTPCKDRPEDFSDFNDPRYPDDPLEQGGKPFPSTAQAEALCVDCPVRELCLAYALKQKEDIGVWGGKRIVSGRVYQGGSGRNGS